MKQVKHTPRIIQPVQPVSVAYTQRQRLRVRPRNSTPRFDERNKVLERRMNRNLLSKAAGFKQQRDLLLFYGGVFIIIILFIASCITVVSTNNAMQLDKLYNECKMERDIYHSQLDDATRQNEALKLEIEQQQATINDYEQLLGDYEY